MEIWVLKCSEKNTFSFMCVKFQESSLQPENVENEMEHNPTYTLTWDNVQWTAERHREGHGQTGSFYLRSLAFFAHNRTSSTHLTVGYILPNFENMIVFFIINDIILKFGEQGAGH